MRSLKLWAIVVLAMLGSGAPAIMAMQATPQPQASPVADATPVDTDGVAYAPEEEIHGASLGEWNARYWQWVTSLPVNENPAQDPSGELCGYGQTGPVFFVPRNFPPCTVPADSAIFVPIAGSECSTVEPPPFHGEDEGDLRECAWTEADRYTGIVVRVNGEIVPDIDAYRAESPVFPLTLPENNVLAVPEGTARAVADGYQIVLKSLPPGTHEIVVHVEVTDGYALPDKTLTLTVVNPSGDD